MNELITFEGNSALLTKEAGAKLAEIETAIKAYKEQEEKLKAAILAEMEAHGIVKVATDDVSVTYIAPTDRETFDSRTFCKDNPDLYDDYVKITPVKASLRIKVS